MISRADLEKLTAIMTGMRDYELALADYYRACAATAKEDEAFWENLAAMEVAHAGHLDRMTVLLKEKPERFEMGRPFNLIALRTAMEGLKENTRKVSEGGLSRERMFFLARDIEQSVLEAKYAEIVRTDDVAFHTLLKGIVAETYRRSP